MTDINKLITENIDVWTSACLKRNSTGRGSSKKINLVGIKKLRDLILDLSVRGKLVPQNESHEPASIALKKIAKEKEQLNKDNKKQKPSTSNRSSEMPFDLPRGWEWVTFGDICEIERGGSPRPIKSFITTEKDGFNWIKIGDTDIGGKYITGTAEKITKEGLSKTRLVYPGDFLLTNSMSFGRPYITKIQGCIHDGWLRISPPNLLDKDYLYSLLSSPFIVKAFKKSASGAVVMNLNADKVRDVTVAIPPIEEQHCIAEKVNELMALCDQLEQQTEASIDAHKHLVEELLSILISSKNTDNFEQSWVRIVEHFDLLFTTEHSIDQLKQTILQLAVMGKLVPQDPNDEPASKVLELIYKEKDQLIKDKVIKKQKYFPVIADAEKPFDLPEGWLFDRFHNLFHDLKYGTSKKSDYHTKGAPILRIPNVVKGFVDSSDLKYAELTVKELNDLSLQFGDVLLIRSNGSLSIVGSCAVVDKAHSGFAYAGYLVRVRLNTNLYNSKFIRLVLQTRFVREQIEKPIRSTSGVKNINSTEISRIIMPIVPLEEQHRIVDKVEELLNICEQLKVSINNAQTIQVHLAQAVVEQALN